MQMRRNRQQLSEAACVEILRRATSGVLAVSGADGYPYAVPLSFVYADGAVYFHCAPQGQKLAALAEDDRASFCVIDRDEVVPERLTTHYKSVILFGRAAVVEETQEKRRALERLAEKYAPDLPDAAEEEIRRLFDKVTVLRLSPERMSGKQAIEIALKDKRNHCGS